MLGVERGTVRGEGWEMDHIRFGAGGRVLVILPGLGDGLRTVRETALPLAAALPGVRQGAEGLSVQQEAGAGARGHHPRDGGGPGGGHEKAGALGCGCARHLPGRNGGAAPGGGGTGVGEAPRPGGDSRLGQRDGAGDRGALAAAGGTRGLPKADAGHSGAAPTPSGICGDTGCCCPCWAPLGGPGATSASSFRPEPASGMTPAARWDGSAVLHWWWAAAGIKWWGQRRPGCWQST